MNGKVKPGYKQTEVGVIPEDWRVTTLGKLVTSVEYGSSAKSSLKGKTPVLRMGNLQSGRIDWSDLVYTDDETEIRRYQLCSGDVLFNRTNTIDLVGKTAIYDGKRPAVFAGYLIRINASKSRLDSRFLNYVLQVVEADQPPAVELAHNLERWLVHHSAVPIITHLTNQNKRSTITPRYLQRTQPGTTNPTPNPQPPTPNP